MEKIFFGKLKFAGIVTDARSNVHAAQNLITKKIPYIFNVKCIKDAAQNLVVSKTVKTKTW
ncbi:hypothetical protein RhiirA4_464749 [Rhizophagus irregularis]|uniref:Uncharacterized protein n=1 Tax=Rhizophagus irregularis TaxID=588596 RepID=A0A2I1GR17_9GLOM|nr:hypothetical protein RhiirA4_464749 [Rhizophagus irregularis]